MDGSTINMIVLGTSIGFLFPQSSGSVTLFGFFGLKHKSFVRKKEYGENLL